MKYLRTSEYNVPLLELTRRNLETLLKKMDDPASLKTLIDPEGVIGVRAVENDAHYLERDPGQVLIDGRLE